MSDCTVIEFQDNTPDTSSPIIVGFYTPKYEALAAKFAKNIHSFGIHYRLYPVPECPAWHSATLLKPAIVLRAMEDYPNNTLVLMDVDCILHGDITEMVMAIRTDVGLYMSAWRERRAYAFALVSSRMTIFRPTVGARRLAEAWHVKCMAGISKNDETCLTIALAETTGVTVETIPLAADDDYTGTEPTNPLVTHVSAHTNVYGRRKKPISSVFKRVRRWVFEAVTGHDYVAWKYKR